MRNSIVTANDGSLIFHPTTGTHWTLYINEYYFDSYGCLPPNVLTTFFNEWNGKCVTSHYKNKENDSCCAAFGLYIFNLIKTIKIGFKSAVLHSYFNK